MKYPKVCIIVLNWNGLRDTLECLESVCQLDYSNFEVIVVDNGSQDESVSVIKTNFAGVILIENKENRGFAGGNNVGIKYALEKGAEYVWLLNNDTIVLGDALKRIVSAAEKSATIGLVSPVIYRYDNKDEVEYSGNYYVDWNTFEFIKDDGFTPYDRDRRTEVLWGTALLVRSDLIKAIGYLNERYFAYHEDIEYSIRAIRAGYEVAVEKEAKVYHKISRSAGIADLPFQVFLRTRNSYFFWMRNLTGLKKIKFFRYFTSRVIASSQRLKSKGLSESADACYNAAWSAIRGIGGRYKTAIRMPKVLKNVLSWHPLFWAEIVKGDYHSVASELYKKLKVIRVREFLV